MPSGVSEHFHEQIRTTVDDLRRIVEIRCRIDHPEQFDDEVDAVERTKGVAHGGKKSKPDEPGAPITLINADLGAELAGQGCSIRIARALTSKKKRVAGEPV